MVMNTLSYSISGLRLVIRDKCVAACNMNSAFKIHPMATLFRTECFRSEKISQKDLEKFAAASLLLTGYTDILE